MRALNSVASLATSGSAVVGSINTKGMRTLVISTRVTYNGAATLGLRTGLRLHNALKQIDTVNYADFTADFTAGATVQESAIFDIEGVDIVDIFVENLDAAQTATDIHVHVTEVFYPDLIFAEIKDILKRIGHHIHRVIRHHNIPK